MLFVSERQVLKFVGLIISTLSSQWFIPYKYQGIVLLGQILGSGALDFHF